MSISFAVAAAATLVALVLTGMLVQRCIRLPRLDQAGLACAGLGVTVALAAQAVGYDRGFGPTTFRAVHLGAQLLAPMALAWALAETTGKSLGSRFAARLALGGVTIVAAVVLASDPLSATAFGKSWPAATAYYQLIPNAILEVIAVVTALAAVIAVAVAAMRARRYPGWHDLFGAVAAAAVAALATDGLRIALPANSAYPAICLLIVALTWFAGRLSSRVRLDVLRLGGPVWNEDTGEFVRYNEDTGEFAPYRDDMYGRSQPPSGAYADGGDDPSYTGWFGDELGDVEPEGADDDFSGWFREGSGGVPQNAPAPAHGGYGPDPDSGLTHSPSASNGHAAAFATGDILPAGDGYLPTAESLPPKLFPPADRGYQLAGGTPDELDTSRLYGQIAIYTLLDGRVDDFDALAERVVEQVKSAEPGTLVYVMHAVPSAPMQRILYQVYRDGAAFDEHARQPYVQRFEEERKPCVLATNVIELGVRHAKFAAAIPGQRPLPGEARPWSNGAR
jgi:quinol monooxygenase YgiN